MTVITPEGSLGDGHGSGHLALVGHLRVRLPVAGAAAEGGLTGILKHLIGLCLVVLRTSGVAKELWLVHQVVLDC